MPQPFNNAVITNQGARLLTRAQAGEIKIEFTRIAIGDGNYTAEEKTLEALQKRTALKSLKNSYTLSHIDVFSDHCVKVTALITNQDPVTGQTLVNAGYYINEMGLFAKVKDGEDNTEVLYSITTTAGDNGDFMPPYNGYNLAQIIQEYFATVNNSAEVTIVNNGAVALAEDLDGLRHIVEELVAPSYTVPNEIEALENGEVLKKAMGKLARAVSSLIDHLNDRNNPHKVTKRQVELDNCDNTSDINKPVSIAQRAAIDEVYTQATGYTDQVIANLIGGAPSTRDTLKEISDAMDEHQDVVQALHEAIGSKANEDEFESHRINSNIHVTTTEKQQIQAHQNFIQNFMQDFMNLFPSYSDKKTTSLQLGGGFDASCKNTIYTAQEDCLVTLYGFVQFLTPPEGATIAANLIMNDSMTIFATTLKGSSTGTNAPISISMRLKEGDSIGAQVLCTGLSAEKGTIVNIHYYLKALPTGLVKSEMT